MEPIERRLLRLERPVLQDRLEETRAILRAMERRGVPWFTRSLVRTSIQNLEDALEANLRRRVGAQLPADARGSRGIERATVRR